jgi:hypothetical protein
MVALDRIRLPGTIPSMSAETKIADDLERADAEAVYRHAFEGQPLDPEIARRVDERADRITQEIYRTHGLIDDETFQKLLSDDDEP